MDLSQKQDRSWCIVCLARQSAGQGVPPLSEYRKGGMLMSDFEMLMIILTAVSVVVSILNLRNK